MPEPSLQSGTLSAAQARRYTAALILVFCALSAMLLPSSARYRGDEKFYTNAVIEMTHTGDYVTPRYDTGELRFRKPILSYWPMLVSFETLGVGLMQSRVPYLLAMCGVLGMAYLLARRMFGRPDAALITVAMLVANVHSLASATRATPDALQAICMILSIYGLAGIALRGSRRWTDYLWFYGGAGLTFATKGGLGLVLVLFGVIFTAWRGRHADTRLRDLIHWPTMLLGLIVALFWYVLVYLQHGDAALAMFFDDQVGRRIDGSKWYILENALVYPLMLLVDLMPWSIFVAIAWLAARDRVRGFWREHRETILFALAWYALLYLIFCLGDTHRTRYFYPAHPPLLATCAAMLCHAVGRDDRAHKLIGVVAGAVFVMCLLIGLGGAIGGWWIDPRVGVAGVLLVVLGVAALVVTRDRWIVAQCVTIGLVILAADRAYDLFVRPVTHTAAAPTLVSQIRQHTRDQMPHVGAIDVKDHIRAQARLLAPDMPIHVLNTDERVADRAALPVLIVPADDAARWAPPGYVVMPGGVDRPALSVKDAIAAIAQGGIAEAQDDKQRTYVLLVRASGDMTARPGAWQVSSMQDQPRPDRRNDDND